MCIQIISFSSVTFDVRVHFGVQMYVEKGRLKIGRIGK